MLQTNEFLPCRNSPARIVVAKRHDTAMVYNMLQSCTKFLSNLGYSHWNGIHTIQRVDQYISTDSVLMLFDNTLFAGIVVVALTAPFYHDSSFEECWQSKRQYGYIGKLCVHPSCHGKGYGEVLLSVAEKSLLENGKSAARLDINLAVKSLSGYYTTRGYLEVGTIGTSILFEKNLLTIV